MTRDELIEVHLPLAHKIARRCYRPGSTLKFDDFVSLAHIGLVRAADSFDATRGCGFAGYAWRCMLTSIRDGLRIERRHVCLVPIDREFQGRSRDRLEYNMQPAQNWALADPRQTVEQLDAALDAARLLRLLDGRTRRLVKSVYLKGQTKTAAAKRERIGDSTAGELIRGGLVEMRRRAELPKAA